MGWPWRLGGTPARQVRFHGALAPRIPLSLDFREQQCGDLFPHPTLGKIRQERIELGSAATAAA
jgi:hypothetical protein